MSARPGSAGVSAGVGRPQQAEPVLGLLPVGRLGEQLDEGLPGADRHQDPVDRDEEGVLHVLVVAPVEAPTHHREHAGGVAHEQPDGAEVEDGPREDGLDQVELVANHRASDQKSGLSRRQRVPAPKKSWKAVKDLAPICRARPTGWRMWKR